MARFYFDLYSMALLQTSALSTRGPLSGQEVAGPAGMPFYWVHVYIIQSWKHVISKAMHDAYVIQHMLMLCPGALTVQIKLKFHILTWSEPKSFVKIMIESNPILSLKMCFNWNPSSIITLIKYQIRSTDLCGDLNQSHDFKFTSMAWTWDHEASSN